MKTTLYIDGKEVHQPEPKPVGVSFTMRPPQQPKFISLEAIAESLSEIVKAIEKLANQLK